MDVDLTDCVRMITAFRDERDWRRFHTPKNLAVSIAIEAAELLEVFQWTKDADAERLDESDRLNVEDEVADIAIYLLLFCEDQAIDLKKAIEMKLAKNAANYPISKARGRSGKYDKL